LLFGVLFPIFWLPHNRRASFEANARELHGERADYVMFVKPIFMVIWISMAVYAATFALRKWVF
jgi:hypothetical protein